MAPILLRGTLLSEYVISKLELELELDLSVTRDVVVPVRHISTITRRIRSTKRLACLTLTRSLSRSAMSLHSLYHTLSSLLTHTNRKTITVQAPSRGCHLITDAIYEGVPELGTPRHPPSRPWCPNQTLLSLSPSSPFTVLLVSCRTGEYSVGMANLFIQHTSASLTINENCDPDVRVDMESALNAIVPESWNKEVRAVKWCGE